MTDQKYSIEHLVNYIGLAQILTGEKPTTIELSPDYYTWYVQSAQQMADAYNLTSGFKEGKVLFNGTLLTKKATKIALK